MPFNLNVPVLNAGVCWINLKKVDGYTLQRNKGTRLCRVLDSEDFRIAWGTRKHCERALREVLSGILKDNPNVKWPVFGGDCFWDAVWTDHGWQVQQNTFTGHYRLLNPKGVRHAWGSRQDCLEIYDLYCRVGGPLQSCEAVENTSRQDDAPVENELVFLVHGFLSCARAMTHLGAELATRGYQVFSENYPTTVRGVEECVELLEESLREADKAGFRRIHFVGHSMGGLMVLSLLRRKIPQYVGNVVLIGSPCAGTHAATHIRNFMPTFSEFFRPILDLTARKQALAPPPELTVGVIAGGTGKERGFNPVLPGDNDGLVEVASTRLPTQRDFLLLPIRHGRLHRHPRVAQAVTDFLRTGRFRTSPSTTARPGGKANSSACPDLQSLNRRNTEHVSEAGTDMRRTNSRRGRRIRMSHAVTDSVRDLEARLEQAYAKVEKEIAKPNVLVMGATGVGKSSLLNLVFGEDIAETGTGKPVTRRLSRYEKRDVPLVLFDSVGYGVDCAEERETLEGTLNAVLGLNREPVEKRIHLVWYCIDASRSRFHGIDGDLLAQFHAAGIPTALVLTKCDLVAEEDIQALRRKAATCFPADNIFRTTTKQLPGQGHLDVQSLCAWSSEHLSEGLRFAFVKAQRTNLALKRRQARRIVGEHVAGSAFVGFVPIPVSDAPLIVANQSIMFARICSLYDMHRMLAEAGPIAKALAPALGVWAAGSIAKCFPGIGTLVGGIINAAVAIALTAAMGEALIRACESAYKQVLDGQAREFDTLNVVKEVYAQVRAQGRNVDLSKLDSQ